MSLEREDYCPQCEADKTFYRAASTSLHLGEKVKWGCPDCDYGFVTIDDDPVTGTEAQQSVSGQ
jgi:rubredoxin